MNVNRGRFQPIFIELIYKAFGFKITFSKYKASTMLCYYPMIVRIQVSNTMDFAARHEESLTLHLNEYDLNFNSNHMQLCRKMIQCL